MNSLSNYINADIQYNINYINESLENNVRMINEAKLITEHAKDIDNLLYKFKTYTYNNLYNTNSLNESDNTYQLSLNEQNTFRDLMIFICEDYRDKLLEELNIYESLIINDELITEGKFIDKIKNKSKNLADNIKATWKLGKDKVNQAIENIKTKIKEVNELIKDYATKAIKSVKEMAAKLVGLLVKFDCTLEGLFEKMGFDTKKEAESLSDISKEIAANPDYIKKNDVYESYANSLNIINEDENSKEGEGNKDIKDKGETQQQAEKQGVKHMLWQGFKQFMIWAGVCVIIPGFVCALFPGTFIALIVPIACKLLWNAYKIKKLVQQWKKVRKEWDSYKKWQKILTAVGIIASIIAIVFNFKSGFESLDTIWKAFAKSGYNLVANANLGIQPDALTRGFAALLTMIKEGKFSFEDFQASFKAITDSFAEHIPQADKVIKHATKIGKSADEVFGEYTGSKFKTSTEAWTKFLKPNGIPIDKVPKGAAVDVVLDGSSASKGAGKLIKFLSDNGYDVGAKDALNGSLNKICKNAGSIWSLKGVPIDLLQKAQDAGIELGNNGWFSILGGVANTIENIPVEDIVNVATSMLVTIPSVEVAPQNNGGFRVRLGGKDDKDNFVYEVGKDGVKKHKVSDYQKEYDKIKEKVAEVNKKFLEDLLKNDKLSDEDKNKVKKDLEEFESNYKEKINTEDCIVFYGTQYNEKDKEEKTNESFISLYNYLIKEAEKSKNDYIIKDIIDNLTDLRKHFEKVVKNAPVKQENEENHKEKSTSQDDTFKGNTQLMLRSIFKFTKSVDKKSGVEKNSTANFKYKEDFKPEPYISIVKRVRDNDSENDMFGKEDIGIPSAYLSIIYDNKKYCDNLQFAFVDVLILKEHLLKISESTKLNDISDDEKQIIIGCYKTMVHHLKQSDKFQTQIDNKEWVPLEFNESIDDKTKEQIKKTEDKNTTDTTPKDVEQKLKDADVTVEPPKPAEQDNQDDSDKKENDKTDESDGKEVPVLMLANNYGIDLADATKSGPRKDVYTLKGIFDSLTFSTFEGGTSVDNITKMLGDILHAQTNNLMSVSANRPCNKDKKGNKFILNDKINKGDTERPDFGMLTNQEITDILNKPENGVKLIKGKSSKYTIAQTEEDKKLQDEKKNEFKGKLEDPDEETVKLVKEIDPKLVDNDGKIKDTDKLSDTLSNYYLAKHKSKGAKKSGGLFSKLKNFVKGLFGGNKDEGKKYNSLLNHFEESLYNNDNLINENLKENNEFLNECFGKMSLSEYIKLKR